MQIFSERLKELRLEYGITQKQLAEKLMTHQAVIAEWERENKTPRTETIIELCKIFDVSTDYLLGLDDQPGHITYGQPKATAPPRLSKDTQDFLKLWDELNEADKIHITGYAKGIISANKKHR